MTLDRRLVSAALGVLAADQLTKAIVRWAIAPGASIPLLGPSIGLTHVSNTGSAFGLLQGQNVILAVVGVIAALALVVWHKRVAPWKGGNVLIGLLVGAILGNVLDRFFFGSVTDFVQLGPWPAFNVADTTLTLGVLGLLYEEWRAERGNKKKE